MNFSGQSAVVTGGSSGLGAATAQALAEEGVRVSIWDLDAERGEAVANETGGLFCKADVADEKAVSAALERTATEIGAPRILVTCAGVGIGEKTVGKNGPHAFESFRRVIDINLVGTFNCARLVAAAMAELDPLADGERGVIVMTASVAAFEGQIGQAAYAASKGGVAAMTLPIARDLMGAGVRCNTIAPGLFETPMMAGLDEKVRDSLAAMVPFPKRLGKPEEFASLALEICRNTMLNGAVLRLDGAIRMQPR